MGFWGRFFGAPKAIRGGAGEPYCSKACYTRGGRYAFALEAKRAQGPCGFCQTQVDAAAAIGIPHEGKTLFVCSDCAPTKWRQYAATYRKCCFCQKEVRL